MSLPDLCNTDTNLSKIQKKALNILETRINQNSLLYSTISGYAEILYNKNKAEFKVIQVHIFDNEPDWELIARAYFTRGIRNPSFYIWKFEIDNKIILSKSCIPFINNPNIQHLKQNVSLCWKPFPNY